MANFHYEYSQRIYMEWGATSKIETEYILCASLSLNSLTRQFLHESEHEDDSLEANLLKLSIKG
jgi:hypothetical protein